MSAFGRDASREAGRQEKLAVYKETGSWPGLKKRQRKKQRQTEAWSESKARKAERKEKRAAKKEKKAAKIAQGAVKKKRRKKPMSIEDLKDLADDIALLKKLKKKKVRTLTKDAFGIGVKLKKHSQDFFFALRFLILEHKRGRRERFF